MGTIQDCSNTCPLLSGLQESERTTILESHAQRGCIEQRLGQIGLLCGMPTGDEKNHITRQVIDTLRNNQPVTVY